MYVAHMTDDQVSSEITQLFKGVSPRTPARYENLTPAASRVRYLRSLLTSRAGRRGTEVLRRYLNILRHYAQTTSYRVMASDIDPAITVLENL